MPNRLQWDLTEVTQEIPNVSSLEGLISNSPSLSFSLTEVYLVCFGIFQWESHFLLHLSKAPTLCVSQESPVRAPGMWYQPRPSLQGLESHSEGWVSNI